MLRLYYNLIDIIIPKWYIIGVAAIPPRGLKYYVIVFSRGNRSGNSRSVFFFRATLAT